MWRHFNPEQQYTLIQLYDIARVINNAINTYQGVLKSGKIVKNHKEAECDTCSAANRKIIALRQEQLLLGKKI